MNVFELKAKREALIGQLQDLQAGVTEANAADVNPRIDALLKDINDNEALTNRAAQIEAITASANPARPTAETAPRAGKLSPAIGMGANDLRNYSMLSAIQAMVDGSWWRENSLEREASEAQAKAMGKSPRGFYLPYDVQAALRTTSDAAGGYLVQTENPGNSFIDRLKNKMVVYRGGAGARILSGLVGDVAIPSLTGGATFYWVAEGTGTNGTLTAADLTFGQVTMTPHTGGAATEISRTLLLQSSIDVEMMVRNQIADAIATGIDAAAIAGTGQNNQPTGAVLTSGINAIDTSGDGSVVDWGALVDLETALAADNADEGALAYACTPELRGYMKQTPRVASTDSRMLWGDGDQPLNGYGAFVSNQMPKTLTQNSGTALHALVFANWADIYIGLWGGLDVLVNPFAHDLAGAIRVVGFQSCDVAVAHAASIGLRKCTLS